MLLKKGNMKILDVCCGSRMFWFDKEDSRAVFVDRRVEQHLLNDKSQKTGKRNLVISPNIQADFTNLPFVSNHFEMVVFDPPHLSKMGDLSWLALKYGKLTGDWREMLRLGFIECFRVLAPGGALIFKWNEMETKVSDILKLVDEKPLFGHRSGKHSKTHWITFTKHNYSVHNDQPVMSRTESNKNNALSG